MAPNKSGFLRYLRPRSVQGKLALVLLPAILLAALATSVVFGALTYRDLRERIQDLGNVQARRYATAVAPMVWNYDLSNLQRFAEVLASDFDVYEIVVTESDGEVMARAAGPNATNAKPWMSATHPITYETSNRTFDLGEIRLTFHNQRLVDVVTSEITRQTFLLIALTATFLIGTLLAYRIVINRPLSALLSAFAKSRNLTQLARADWQSDDEFGQLVEGYESMRRKLEQEGRALIESEARFRVLQEASSSGIVIHDGTVVVDANHSMLAMTGYTLAELVGMPVRDLFGGDLDGVFSVELIETSTTPSEMQNIHGLRKNGKRYPAELRCHALPHKAGTLFVAEVADVTQRRQADEARLASEERLRAIAEVLPDLIFLLDEDGRYVEVLAAQESLIYGDADGLKGRYMQDVLPPEMADTFQNFVRRTLESGQTQRLEYELTVPAGRRWFEGRSAVLNSRLDGKRGVVFVARDMTDLKQAEEDIRFRAYYDSLTHLPNRVHFLESLSDAIERARRTEVMTALLFIDLDRFKNINDSQGHHRGDEMLKEVAKRLKRCVRSTDTVARLGGDEFTVVTPDLTNELHASKITETILEALSQPYDLFGQEIYASASIGITICPTDGDDVDTLLRNADMAMYEAKESGRNTYRFFTRAMTERARLFVETEKNLRQAIERREFVCHFQPMVDVATGAFVGVEALVRWNHPTRGLLVPADFIRVAEETDLIAGIGEQVLLMACGQVIAYADKGLPPDLRLSVNVSSRQFMAGFDGTVVGRILRETGFPPDRLTLEITESLLLEEDDQVSKVLNTFRNMGIRLAIDDFGTGYSSLSYLRRLPIDIIKIDKAFTNEMDIDASSARLVETIITLSHGLGMEVVAEGVETPVQQELLSKLGCDMAQGYLFSRPVPLDDLVSWGGP